MKIMIEDEDVRAVRGGTGYAKCGGNYAASNRAGERAAQKGYSQVLWLDGVERKYIEEVGAMNVMFKINATDAANPAVVASVAMSESFYMDVAADGTAYIATTGGKVSAVKDDAVVGTFNVANAYAVGLYDKYALVAPKAQGDFVLAVVDTTTGETVATVTADTDLSAGSQFVYVKVCGDTLFVVVQNDRILSAKLF